MYIETKSTKITKYKLVKPHSIF